MRVEKGWMRVENGMKTPRRFHSTVTVGNEIYIIGGEDNNNKRLDSVEIFDTLSRSITNGPKLPVPMLGMSAVVVLEKYIIISGGWTTGRSIGESYILNTGEEKQEWKPLNILLNTPRSFHTAVVLNNNKICICGGSDSDGNILNTIEYMSLSQIGIDFLTKSRSDFL